MADIQELLRQREALERQIKQMQSSVRSDAIAQIKELMSQYNLYDSRPDCSGQERFKRTWYGGPKVP